MSSECYWCERDTRAPCPFDEGMCPRAMHYEIERLRDENAQFQKAIDGSPREIIAIYDRHADWSRKTFGDDAFRGPMGPLKHLHKEVGEAIDDPTDRLEYADMQLLVWDAARRAGIDLAELMRACREKLEINANRDWPDPHRSDEAIEHNRAALKGGEDG